MTADDAYGLGMVSKIFPLDQIEELTDEWALRIARMPTMAALLVKEAVNQAVDIMGFTNSLNASFSLHQINHAHWMYLNPDGAPVGTPQFGIPSWRDAPAVMPAQKTSSGASAPAHDHGNSSAGSTS
jgi:enoyl-CoA hydratase